MPFVTNKELTIPLKGMEYIVPAGTLLTNICADGSCMEDEFFVEDLSFIKSEASRHDPYYYGLRVKPVDAEELCDESQPVALKAITREEADAIKKEMTNVVNLTIKQKASGIKPYVYQPGANKMAPVGNVTFREPTMVWYMNLAQLGAINAYLQVVDQIKIAHEKRIALLLKNISIG